MLKDYTTQELKQKDPDKEKDKVVISNDMYAVCDYLDRIFNKLKENK